MPFMSESRNRSGANREGNIRNHQKSYTRNRCRYLQYLVALVNITLLWHVVHLLVGCKCTRNFQILAWTAKNEMSTVSVTITVNPKSINRLERKVFDNIVQ